MRADARESLASLQGVAAGVLRIEARLESLAAAAAAPAPGPAAPAAGSGGPRAEKQRRNEQGSMSKMSGSSGSMLRMGGSTAELRMGGSTAELRRQAEGLEGAGEVRMQDLVRVMGSADQKLDDIGKRLQKLEEKV